VHEVALLLLPPQNSLHILFSRLVSETLKVKIRAGYVQSFLFGVLHALAQAKSTLWSAYVCRAFLHIVTALTLNRFLQQ
jgi:hypothetical protein